MDQGIVKYTVRVELNRVGEGVDIPLGATADVRIQNGEPKQGLAVPIRAIQNDAQGEYVNRIGTDGSIQRLDVTSGDIVGDLVIVIGDLQAGERVILIFDRFWREEKSRSRTTGGAGLGLAIARQLVEAQGGKITARNLPRGGLCVSFTLPVQAK